MKGAVGILCAAACKILNFHQSLCLFFNKPQHLWYGDGILGALLGTSAKITDRLKMYATNKGHMIQTKFQDIPYLHIIYSRRNDRHKSNTKLCF